MKKLVVRTYKFRLYPSQQVVDVMEGTLDACRFLYNAELEYEKQLYFLKGEYASRSDLNSLILDWKVINPDLRLVHSQVLQDVSDRLTKSFEKFFRKEKNGKRSGFPRFKSKQRYDSFTFPQSGFKLEGSKLKLSKIGEINIKLHRKIEGKVKTLNIKKTRTNKWFACFIVIVEKEMKEKEVKVGVGIDLGLNSFYADSEGNKVDNPRWFRKSEERLGFLQRKHSKKQKGSNNFKKYKLKIARLHEKIVNQRNDFLHKESRKLCKYSIIVVEKLSVRRMVRDRYLAKSVSDVSWNRFLQFLAYKVEETGGQIIEINASGTSQFCICGNRVKKSLSTRIHKCGRCGSKMDRDVMSAILIKALALDSTVGTAGINACGDVQENVCEARSQQYVGAEEFTLQ